jgi:palmitoyltransferase
MAGFRGPSPSPPQSPRRRPGFVRRCERCCGAAVRFFPLALVYGLTTWAMLSQVQTCVAVRATSWKGKPPQ